MRRVTLTSSEGDVFLMVAATGMTFHTLYPHIDVDRLPAQWNSTKAADCEAIPYNIFTSALRTAKFFDLCG